MIRVLQVLEAGPLSADELEKALGTACADARQAIRGAVLDGAVDLNDSAKYLVTARGWEILAGADVVPLVDDVPPELPNTLQQRIWSAMRQLGKFSRLNLDENARQPNELRTNFAPVADVYIRLLERSGYLWRLDFPAVKGSGGGRARFRLVRDTGILAPVIKPGPVVCDRNTGESYVAEK